MTTQETISVMHTCATHTARVSEFVIAKSVQLNSHGATRHEMRRCDGTRMHIITKAAK